MSTKRPPQKENEMSDRSRGNISHTNPALQSDSVDMDGVLASSQHILSESDTEDIARFEVPAMRDAFHGLQQKVDSLQAEVDELYDAKQTLEDCSLDRDEADELRRFRDWAEPALKELVAFRKRIENNSNVAVARTEPLPVTEGGPSLRKRTKNREEVRNVDFDRGTSSENKKNQFTTQRPDQQ